MSVIVANMPSLATVLLVVKLAELFALFSLAVLLAMTGSVWSTPAKTVAPSTTGSTPEVVSDTAAVPTLGESSTQVSDRTPLSVACCRRVSVCAPKVTAVTVFALVVDTPTAR